MKITKADLDENNYYTASESLDVDGEIEIESGLGTVRFKGCLEAKTYILTGGGTGIEAWRRHQSCDDTLRRVWHPSIKFWNSVSAEQMQKLIHEAMERNDWDTVNKLRERLKKV